MKTFEVALDECTTVCLLGYTCTSKKATLPFLIVEWGGGEWEGGRHWVSNSYCKGGMVGSGVVIVGRGGEIWDLA